MAPSLVADSRRFLCTFRSVALPVLSSSQSRFQETSHLRRAFGVRESRCANPILNHRICSLLEEPLDDVRLVQVYCPNQSCVSIEVLSIDINSPIEQVCGDICILVVHSSNQRSPSENSWFLKIQVGTTGVQFLELFQIIIDRSRYRSRNESVGRTSSAATAGKRGGKHNGERYWKNQSVITYFSHRG